VVRKFLEILEMLLKQFRIITPITIICLIFVTYLSLNLLNGIRELSMMNLESLERISSKQIYFVERVGMIDDRVERLHEIQLSIKDGLNTYKNRFTELENRVIALERDIFTSGIRTKPTKGE
jgi:hypothetical protein